MQEKKLFLLDGHALVYRAHYSFITRPLINSKGLNTSAITGFVRALWDIISKYQPTHIAVSFDLSGPTFRHEYFPEYKANREAQPEDITIAFPYIKKIIEGFNIPIVTLERYEADDIIGTLAKQAEKEGFKIFMVTPDKDYAQLVSDNIFMFKPSRQGGGEEILGKKEILEEWDIARVDQVIDVLGLQGDSVDNIPGIPGIGPKTAVKLLKDFDTVEGVVNNAIKLKGKQKENVIEYKEQALLSKRLATIDIDAPISFDEKTYRIENADKEALAEIFKELEFRTLSEQILGTHHMEGVQSQMFKRDEDNTRKKVDISIASDQFSNESVDYQLIEDDDSIDEIVKSLEKLNCFCFDTETTGLDPNDSEIVGLAFSWEKGKAYYIPFSEKFEEAKKRLNKFKNVLENERIIKRAQNIKYDALLLKWYDIEVKGYFEDSMLMHYLLEPDLRHNMDYLSETYLSYKPISITELIGKRGNNQLSMRDVDPVEVAKYAGEDADITNQLVDYFIKDIEKEEILYDVYKTIEEPLCKVLIDMEYNGIKVDPDFLRKYSKEIDKILLEREQNIYKNAGVEFNISSPKQVGEVLFDHLRIPYRWRKTKSGQYSTSEEKLAELAQDHDIVKDILNYRMFAKLKSTYVDTLPNLINRKDGRIHSSFNQALAATGRLSSNNPNLQNIPIRTPEGRHIRKAFVPKDEEHILLAVDYSQVELRLIAEIANEEAMLDAFRNNLDIHRTTAAKVFEIDYDIVTADQRRAAKTVNFSIIYGAGATNLSQQLNIPRKEASELIGNYFAQYKGLKKYMEDTVEFARKNGFVKTLSGRRRQIRDINSRNGLARSGAERIAINSPIQGTAADLIKLAMIKIHSEMKRKNFKSMLILQVHDELVFDVYKPELDELRIMVETEMKNALPGLKVPLLVESGTGKNWLEAH